MSRGNPNPAIAMTDAEKENPLQNMRKTRPRGKCFLINSLQAGASNLPTDSEHPLPPNPSSVGEAFRAPTRRWGEDNPLRYAIKTQGLFGR
jgi:hypothetical protein